MVSTRPDLRVGDVERDATATSLREHYAQGRLSTDELNERLDAAFSARTRGELDQITYDLPHIQPALPEMAVRDDAGRSEPDPRGAATAIALLAGLIVLVVFTLSVTRVGHHPVPNLGVLLIGLLILRGMLHHLFGRRWDRRAGSRNRYGRDQNWHEQRHEHYDHDGRRHSYSYHGEYH